jgi:hypothetical protein
MGGQGFNRGKWGNGGVGVGFVLLTHSTPFYILSDIGNEAWPPEFGGDKLASFKVAGVAGCLMVVAALENHFTEEIVVGT